MFGSILKKKLSDNQLANVFLNGILEVVDHGFSEVADLINDDLAFVNSPNIEHNDSAKFSMVVIAANISSLENTFEADQAVRIEQLIFDKLAQMMQTDKAEAEATVRDYQKFMQLKT